MDAAHLHLILNHFPIVGTIIGLFIYGHGLYHNQKGVTNTALVLFASLSVVSILTYVTGENAEDIIETMAGISHAVIEEHEEIAEFSLWSGLLLGFLSAVTLYYTNRTNASVKKWLHLATLLLAFGNVGALSYTAYTGGKINHPELHGNFEVNHSQEREHE